MDTKINKLLQGPLPNRSNTPQTLPFSLTIFSSPSGGDETPKFHLPRESTNKKSQFVKTGSIRSSSGPNDDTFGSPVAQR